MTCRSAPAWSGGPEGHLGWRRSSPRAPIRSPLDDELPAYPCHRDPAAVHGAVRGTPARRRAGRAGGGDRAGLDRAPVLARAQGRGRRACDRRRPDRPARRRGRVRRRRDGVEHQLGVGARWPRTRGRTSWSRRSATRRRRSRTPSRPSRRAAPCWPSGCRTRRTTRSRSPLLPQERDAAGGRDAGASAVAGCRARLLDRAPRRCSTPTSPTSSRSPRRRPPSSWR